MNELLNYLRGFCDACGVSGFEEDGGIADFVINEIKPYADEIYLDKAGNIIAFKKGRRTPKKRVLFAAHMDEVGFVIKHINSDGTLLFDDIGISASAMPCERVRIGKNRVPGAIGMTPVHLLSRDERKKPVEAEKLFIDIGAATREEAERLVSPGDYAVFDSDFVLLSETRFKAKATDDRIGCAILCRLIKSELEYDAYFAFTVGEELGTRGACAAANDVKPDIAVIAESTTAADIYGNNGADAVCRLGEGVVLPFMDGGTAYDRELRLFALDTAKELGISAQTKTKIAGGTDARTIQRASGGASVLGAALPCRYIHTSSCVADLADAESMERMIFALAERLGGFEA